VLLRQTGLFVELDQHFLRVDGRHDAVAVPNWLVSQKLGESDHVEFLADASSFANTAPFLPSAHPVSFGVMWGLVGTALRGRNVHLGP
jgi:hypothetical protein